MIKIFSGKSAAGKILSPLQKKVVGKKTKLILLTHYKTQLFLRISLKARGQGTRRS